MENRQGKKHSHTQGHKRRREKCARRRRADLHAIEESISSTYSWAPPNAKSDQETKGTEGCVEQRGKPKPGEEDDKVTRATKSEGRTRARDARQEGSTTTNHGTTARTTQQHTKAGGRTPRTLHAHHTCRRPPAPRTSGQKRTRSGHRGSGRRETATHNTAPQHKPHQHAPTQASRHHAHHTQTHTQPSAPWKKESS